MSAVLYVRIFIILWNIKSSKQQSNRIFSKRIIDFIKFYFLSRKNIQGICKKLLLIVIWCNRNDLLKNLHLFRYLSLYVVGENV